MQSFIVLGIIPGTNVQTTLNFWVGVTITLTALLLRGQFRTVRNYIHLYLAIRSIAHTIESHEFNPVT